jgi:lipopolysaccharide/colanic/teichoic acid biosynthesis glycosyltransferase
MRESGHTLSAWTCSSGKRWFDFLCVALTLPLLLPVCAVLALVVYCSSRGPALFVQNRVGRNGATFRLFKFRTILLSAERGQSGLTTARNQNFTPPGRFLRSWKLDELPQLYNVLAGDMSLVGPRPKLQKYTLHELHCRPGITGAASFAFASEETALARIPNQQLETFYYDVVLPAKRKLDADYMARATLFSDLKLILNSAAHLWDDTYLTGLIESSEIAFAGCVPERIFGD